MPLSKNPGMLLFHLVCVVSISLPVHAIDVIPILPPAVYCDFGRCGSQRFTLRFDGCIKSIEVVVFSKATI